MNRDIEGYKSLIKEALEAIDERYFRLPVTYYPSQIIRERIFSYEMYHQMRQRMNTDSNYLIHGEPDKAGHRGFLKEHQKNPDFIFHVPGTFQYNLLVVEVKGNLHKTGLIKDFETLLNFTETYNYQSGVLVLFGHSINDLKSRI